MVALYKEIALLLRVFTKRQLKDWDKIKGNGKELEYYGSLTDTDNPSSTVDNIKYIHYFSFEGIPSGERKRHYRQHITYNADDTIKSITTTLA
jgi:hypothetical protein